MNKDKILATATIVTFTKCGICGKTPEPIDAVLIKADMFIPKINIFQRYHRDCWHIMTARLTKEQKGWMTRAKPT